MFVCYGEYGSDGNLGGALWFGEHIIDRVPNGTKSTKALVTLVGGVEMLKMRFLEREWLPVTAVRS